MEKKCTATDAGTATLLFWEYWPLASFNVKDPMAVARNVAGSAAQTKTDIISWLRKKLEEYPQCCRCSRHLPKNQKRPTCDDHKSWYRVLEERYRSRCGSNEAFVAFAKERAGSKWNELIDGDGKTPESDVWTLFEDFITPYLPGNGGTPSAPLPVTRLPAPVSPSPSGPSSRPVPAPVPPPPPPLSAPLTPDPIPVPPPIPHIQEDPQGGAQVVARSPLLPPIQRALTGAENTWVSRNRIQEEYGFTRDELLVVIAALEQYKKSHADLPTKGMMSAAARFRKEELPELAKRIIAAREAPSAPVPPHVPSAPPNGEKKSVMLHARLAGIESRLHGLIVEVQQIVEELGVINKEFP